MMRTLFVVLLVGLAVFALILLLGFATGVMRVRAEPRYGWQLGICRDGDGGRECALLGAPYESYELCNLQRWRTMVGVGYRAHCTMVLLNEEYP